MLFTTPYIVCSITGSLIYIFLVRQDRSSDVINLPVYPEPSKRDNLYVIAGEVHQPKRPELVSNPRWLTIPDRGLYTGTMVLGAVGSGKTSGRMYPFAEQILAFNADDPANRVGGLILEVKGDFCHKVKGILEKHGRGEDYLELGLDSPYRYNPLHNDHEAYALAYGIASRPLRSNSASLMIVAEPILWMRFSS